MTSFLIASQILVFVHIAFGELVAPIKNFLKITFWHHWLGKGVVLAVLFIILSVIGSFLFKKHEEKDEPYIIGILSLTILGALYSAPNFSPLLDVFNPIRLRRGSKFSLEFCNFRRETLCADKF